MSSSILKMEEYYKNLFNKFGYSTESLGWHKGNQFLRFYQLTNHWELENSSILDVGCGFGDFNKYLELNKITKYNYVGIDLLNDFITEANKQYSNENINFILGNFMKTKINTNIDYSIASGTFNYKIKEVDCYNYVYDNMKKMFDISNKAIAIDFLSSRVDYFHEHNFNYCPSKILEMAYGLSRRVILNNSFLPFEFAIVIFKDDEFDPKTSKFYEIK